MGEIAAFVLLETLFVKLENYDDFSNPVYDMTRVG